MCDINFYLAELFVPKSLRLCHYLLEGSVSDLRLRIRTCLVRRYEGNSNAEGDLFRFSIVREESSGLIHTSYEVDRKIEVRLAETFSVQAEAA